MARRKYYRKLIRDLIPDIIERNGSEAVTRTLNAKQFEKELRRKFIEEAKELAKTKTKKQTLEEMADLLELIDELSELNGIPRYAIERLQREKRRQRGGFKKRLYLISTN